jgi:hypothetical protein
MAAKHICVAREPSRRHPMSLVMMTLACWRFAVTASMVCRRSASTVIRNASSFLS